MFLKLIASPTSYQVPMDQHQVVDDVLEADIKQVQSDNQVSMDQYQVVDDVLEADI